MNIIMNVKWYWWVIVGLSGVVLGMVVLFVKYIMDVAWRP